jgi:hypothetical protein
MSGYNFSDRVRNVLLMARDVAAQFRHAYVGTEHILMALIHEGAGVGAAVLTNLNVNLEDVQHAIEQTVKEGGRPPRDAADLPYTSRAKKVLELAMSEARELNHPYVGSEHLLLGLIREERGIAAQALADAGVTLGGARTEMLRLLGTAEFGQPRQTVVLEADQRFKTAIALIELHRTRFGTYPDSLDDLQFLGGRDRPALAGLEYEKLKDGYALDIVSTAGAKPPLDYPRDFWRGLGLRRTNVPGGSDS